MWTRNVKSLIINFFRNSSLAVLVYSIDDKNSFEDLKKWLKEIRNQSNSDIKIVLVGNKIDLEDKREVSYEKGKKFMEENELLFFKEASAKSGLNVKEIFNDIANILYEEYMKFVEKANNFNYNKINDSSINSTTLKTFYDSKERKKCCL